MTTKAGSVIFQANTFTLDRVQTGGASGISIPQTRVFEDGNPHSVGLIRDTPDITFDVESWDMSTDLEALIVGLTPSSVVTGQQLDLSTFQPVDILSPWRKQNSSNIVAGAVIIPSLILESAAYKYAVKQQAAETFTFKGDSMYWVPGSPYRQAYAAAGAGPYALTHTAIRYTESGVANYVLAVCWIDTDGTYQRLFHNLDYTDTNGGFTLTAAAAAAMPGTATLHAMYGSLTSVTLTQQMTATSAVKPAAFQSKDIDVYVSDGQPTPTLLRWDGVQSADCTWKVTLTPESELGNPHYVTQDFDVPDVSGTITVRPSSVANLLTKLGQASNVTAGEIVGLLSSTPLQMEIHVNHPDTGARIKTLYIPDARFTLPTAAIKANSTLDFPFPFQSETGVLEVIKGIR